MTCYYYEPDSYYSTTEKHCASVHHFNGSPKISINRS